MKTIAIRPKIVLWIATSATPAEIRNRIAQWAAAIQSRVESVVAARRNVTLAEINFKLKVHRLSGSDGTEAVEIYPKFVIVLSVPDNVSERQAAAYFDSMLDAAVLWLRPRLQDGGDALLRVAVSKSSGKVVADD